jgi:hypothetical protein
MKFPNATSTWFPEGFGTIEIEQKINIKSTPNPLALQKVSEFIRKHGPVELEKATDEEIWERIKKT